MAGPADQPEPDIQIPETPYPPEISIDLPSPAALPPPFEHSSWPSKDRPEGLDVGGPHSPGGWSTAATPGTALFPGMNGTADDEIIEQGEDSLEPEDNNEREVENFGTAQNPEFTVSSPSGDYKAPDPQIHESLPPGFVVTHIDGSPISPSAPPFENNQKFSPPPAPIVPPLPPPPVPQQQHSSSQAAYPSHPSRQSPYHAPPPPPPEVVPTPQQITKAQKHCRFAVSALDYEDFSQARKDLREALRLIGG